MTTSPTADPCINTILDLYGKNLEYAQKLVADLPADKWAFWPAPKMNHAAWVIGHLARTSDLAASLIDGKPTVHPEIWMTLFGPVSQPTDDASVYPAGAELLAELEKAHARLTQAMTKADLSVLDQPPALERLRGRFPTLRPFIFHVMLTHEMVHLGQLSAWRRVQGLPGVLGGIAPTHTPAKAGS